MLKEVAGVESDIVSKSLSGGGNRGERMGGKGGKVGVGMVMGW